MEYHKNGNVFSLLSKASEDVSDSNEPDVQQEVRTLSDCRRVLTCVLPSWAAELPRICAYLSQ
jgi:hypothetical protein